MIKDPAIGQTVIVTVPGEFVGCSAVIVKQHKRGRNSRFYVGLKFDNHLWQRESPNAVWWFHVRELEEAPHATT